MANTSTKKKVKTEPKKKTISKNVEVNKGKYLFVGWLLGIETGILMWAVSLITYALT